MILGIPTESVTKKVSHQAALIQSSCTIVLLTIGCLIWIGWYILRATMALFLVSGIFPSHLPYLTGKEKIFDTDTPCFSGIIIFSHIPSDILRSDFSTILVVRYQKKNYQMHFWDDSETRR